jgi:hypothetical protein
MPQPCRSRVILVVADCERTASIAISSSAVGASAGRHERFLGTTAQYMHRMHAPVPCEGCRSIEGGGHMNPILIRNPDKKSRDCT